MTTKQIEAIQTAVGMAFVCLTNAEVAEMVMAPFAELREQQVCTHAA
jgi:hypothetical protein